MTSPISQEEQVQVNNWLQTFLSVGGSVSDLAKITPNRVQMQRVVEYVQSGAPDWNRVHPRRYYDLSALLGLAEPLQEIVWPEVELAANQYLIVYRGEKPSQVLPRERVTYCELLSSSSFWNLGVKEGVYLITVPDSAANETELCTEQAVEPAPFVLGLMFLLAHQSATGELIAQNTICPATTKSGKWLHMLWQGNGVLHCLGNGTNSMGSPLLCKRLGSLKN